MIILQIKDLIFKKQVAWRRKVTLVEIAEATGISRMTLHRMLKDSSYNASLEHLDKLCAYFQCEIAELVRFRAGGFSEQTISMQTIKAA